MKRVVNSLVTHLSTLVLLAVSVGAGMLSLPAGFITGGGLAIAGAVLSMLGEDEEK